MRGSLPEYGDQNPIAVFPDLYTKAARNLIFERAVESITVSSLRLLLASLLLTTFWAGCLEQGRIQSEPFSVPVPAWQAGHAWTYKVEQQSTSESSDSREGGGPQSYRPPPSIETITVFNTTHRLGHESAYFAWFAEAPLVPKNVDKEYYETLVVHSPPTVYDLRPVQVYRQADLLLVARGTLANAGGTCYGACNAISLVDQEAQRPRLEFPLEPGKRWSPTREAPRGGSPGDLSIVADYEVVGHRPINVAGLGARTGVLVHATGRLLDEDRLRALVLLQVVPNDVRVKESVVEYRFGADYYWGEEEKNLLFAQETTRFEVHVKGVDSLGKSYRLDAEFSEDQKRILAKYSLAPAPEEQLPFFRVEGISDSDLAELLNVSIVSDAPEYSNVADGPLKATYRVAGTYNESRFEPRWTLHRAGNPEPLATGTGLEFPVNLDRAGAYRIQAGFFDRAFESVVHASELSLNLRWEARVQSEVDPGPAAPLTLIRFPVESGDAFVLLDFQTLSATPVPTLGDDGSYHLSGPNGFSRNFAQPNGYAVFEGPAPGEYVLEWRPSRPVVLGDDPQAHVRVNYSGLSYFGPID